MIDLKTANITNIIEGTPGGRTYFVILPDKPEKALCMRTMHKKGGQSCTNPAGYGTDHPGTGACKYHGGCVTGQAVITTGNYAIVTRSRLAEKIDEYLSKDRAQLLDMTGEFAALKVIFNEVLDKAPDPNAKLEITDGGVIIDHYGRWLNQIQKLLSTMGTLVEKITQADSRNTLTAAQVVFFKTVVADILIKHLSEPADRERAVKELTSRLGGLVEPKVGEYIGMR
jgi:hypothetical protein